MFMSSQSPHPSTSTQIMPPKLGEKTKLPDGFIPGKYAVLCGRGSKCTKSLGNQRLRHLVESHLHGYSAARNKVEKTVIVTSIIDAVKQVSPDGGFVKYEDGCWWEVDDAFAREKIGCLFRDSLHTQYRSSTKAKLARKKGIKSCSSVSKTQSVPKPEQPRSMNDMLNIGGAGTFKKSETALRRGDMKSLFGNSGRNGMQTRPDFLRGCISDFDQVMRGGYLTAANNAGNNRPVETSSLLRRACDIIGGPSSEDAKPANTASMHNLDNGDLPDDLSDISDLFEDDDFNNGFVDFSPVALR